MKHEPAIEYPPDLRILHPYIRDLVIAARERKKMPRAGWPAKRTQTPRRLARAAFRRERKRGLKNPAGFKKWYAASLTVPQAEVANG